MSKCFVLFAFFGFSASDLAAILSVNRGVGMLLL